MDSYLDQHAIQKTLGATLGEGDGLARLQEELRIVTESEAYFRTLYETTIDAVLLIDERGIFDCNPATVTMFRASGKQQVCQCAPEDLSPPLQPDGKDSGRLAADYIVQAMRHGHYRFEWLARRFDGELFPADITLVALSINGRQVVQCVARDHTEQKRHEAELLRAKQQAEVANRELQRALHEVERLASTDALTGVWNRRYFNRVIGEEVARSKCLGEHLTLLILDIDHFKQINDSFGHDVGDNVLCEVARVLQGRLRSTDFLVRWGGEEFVVLVSGASQEEARSLAESLRIAVAEHARFGVEQVTVSIGIAERRENESIAQWLSRADKALYQAKIAGRNRTGLA